jgi:hypothetical protein
MTLPVIRITSAIMKSAVRRVSNMIKRRSSHYYPEGDAS